MGRRPRLRTEALPFSTALAAARRKAVEIYRAKPLPERCKHSIIIQHGKSYGLRTLVETGTYQGDTLAACAPHFDRLASIEIGEDLYRAAQARFSSATNVHLILGDSADQLPTLVAALEEPALFWLDGHYSGGDTVRGKNETPISRELEAVFGSPYDHVVLIDDARDFGGALNIGRRSAYPTLREVRRLVRRRRPTYRVALQDDIIRLRPPEPIT